MSTLNKITSTLIMIFISYQGLLLLVDPSIRNRLYSTVAEISNKAIPLAQSIAEHGRIILAVMLLPTFLYPKSWLIPKFVSLIAYVFYVSIIYNLYLFNTPYNVAQLLFHLFILLKTILIIVDQLTECQFEQRKAKRIRQQKKAEALARQEQSKVAKQQVAPQNKPAELTKKESKPQENKQKPSKKTK